VKKLSYVALTPYLFLLPAIVIMAAFVYIPIVNSFIFSLYQWSAIDPVWEFVGFKNFHRIIEDSIFWKSIINNGWYAVISVAVQVFFALFLAAVIESTVFPRPLSNFFRTTFFIPSVLAITIVGATWQLLYRPDMGLINQMLSAIGLESLTHAWLGEENTAIFAIIAVSQWQWTGYILILFIVAIQAVSQDLYESALMDGANWWQQFFHITVPSVRETTLVMATITLIGAFKVFDIVWVMTAGGPNHASEVLGNYLYRVGFRNDEMGYASALATVLFVITFLLAFGQLRLGRSGEEI
jgi:raffinose/stachyose/melibiose transport system permease protein